MPKAAAKRSSAPAAIVAAPDGAFEQSLFRALLLVRESRPKSLKGGGLPSAFSRALAKELEEAAALTGCDAETFGAFVLALARGANLLSERDERLTLDTAACDEFFTLTPDARLLALREAWLDTDLNEFLHIPTLEVIGGQAREKTVHQTDAVPGVERIKAIRRGVLALLEELPQDKWVSLNEASALLAERQPHFLVPKPAGRGAMPDSYHGIRLCGEKAELVRADNWNLVEGALLEQLLKLPLFWLGYVDLADVGAFETCRIKVGQASSLPVAGSKVRRASSLPQPGGQVGQASSLPGSQDGYPTEAQKTGRLEACPTEKPLFIQGNFEITALLPEMDMCALWKLGRVASLQSWGQVARFTLEERFVAAALNDGIALDDITGFLEANSKGGLPQNVRFALEDWVRRTQRITIYLDADLFEAEGVEDLKKLVREDYRKHSKLVPVAGKHLAGPSSAAKDPREAAGPRYPVLDYSRPLPPVVVAHDDGALACLSEERNFRVLRVLERVAEQKSLDRWQLTRERVRAAIERGLPFDRLLEQLVAVVKNDLPPLLKVRLLAWAGKLGSVTIEHVPVLSFEKEDVANLLVLAAKTRAYMRKPLNETTFRLDAASLEDVKALLKELEG